MKVLKSLFSSLGKGKTQAKIALLEALHRSQAVIEFELDGTIIEANENFLKTMGYSLSEIAGKHHKIFVDPAYAHSKEYKQFWQTLRAGKFQTAQFKRYAKCGKEVWIQASYNPILDKEGNPYRVIKIATDITEQVRQKERCNLLSLVADHTNNGVVICNQGQIVEYVNPGFVTLTGISAQHSTGENIFHILSRKNVSEATIRHLKKCVQNSLPFDEEILNYHQNGDACWTRVTASPIKNQQGQVERYALNQR